MTQEAKRIFVGIPIEAILKEELSDFFRIQLYDPKMRWTPNNNLHITLVFKGKTDPSKITGIKSQLSDFFKNTKCFELFFDKFTVMPFQNPRMLWAKFQRSTEHTELAFEISKILEVKPDPKPIPHITLTRFKLNADYKSLKLAVPIENRSMIVKKVHLYESILNPAGAEYHILDTYYLS